MNLTALISAWLVCGILTAGAMNASFRGDFPNVYADAVRARNRGASSIGYGLMFGPFGLLISPFMTGFYQHGWTLDMGPLKS